MKIAVVTAGWATVRAVRLHSAPSRSFLASAPAPRCGNVPINQSCCLGKQRSLEGAASTTRGLWANVRNDMQRRLTAEFFGTFWLVFGGCGSAVLSAAYPQLGIGFLDC